QIIAHSLLSKASLNKKTRSHWTSCFYSTICNIYSNQSPESTGTNWSLAFRCALGFFSLTVHEKGCGTPPNVFAYFILFPETYSFLISQF
ncbi:MAG: hypothetical protein RSD59_06055, partial [Lactococcus sp.]